MLCESLAKEERFKCNHYYIWTGFTLHGLPQQKEWYDFFPIVVVSSLKQHKKMQTITLIEVSSEV